VIEAIELSERAIGACDQPDQVRSQLLVLLEGIQVAASDRVSTECKVMLLSGHDESGAVRLPQPIKNDLVLLPNYSQ